MGFRAAILLLVPSLAFAQTAAVTVLPTQLNRDACTAGTRSLTLTWSFSTAVVGDKYRLTGQTSCPTTPPVANGTGTLGDDIAWNGSTTQSQSVTLGKLRDATGVSCTGVNDQTAKICVYIVSASTQLVGSADFAFRTALPPAPATVTASPASSALSVNITPGTKNNTDATVESAAYQVLVYDSTSTTLVTSSSVQANTTIRVSGLTNGVAYTVRALAFTSTDADIRNQSATYTQAAGTFTPQQFDDFWTRYQAAGGREQGGCGAGGAGALSPLLLALALLWRRRR
jgi:uncharacterized protein (TIGR03382 family)